MLFLTISGMGQPSQQERLGDARCKLVRRSLEFLATDRTTFTSVTQPLCPECGSKEDFIDFIKVNQLKGTESRLYQWLIIPDNALDSNTLTALKSRIIDDLTVGPEKDFRKELASYTAYVQDMDAIVSGVQLPDPETVVVPVATKPPAYMYTLLILLAVTTAILTIKLNEAFRREKINIAELKKAHKDLKNLQVKLKEQEILTRKSAGELIFLKDQLQFLEQELKSGKKKSRESPAP